MGCADSAAPELDHAPSGLDGSAVSACAGLKDGTEPEPFESALARKVCDPVIPEMDLGNRSGVEIVLKRVVDNADDSLSTLLHLQHLFGANATTKQRSTDSPSLISDLICNGDLARKHFGYGSVLAKTRHGLRFPLLEPWALALDQSVTQSHPGQGLASLASAGVAKNTPVTVHDQLGPFFVKDIFNDVVANFFLDGEIYWDAVGIAIYLPPQKTWTNKFGEEYSFDQLVEELIRRPPADSSCSGTHGLISLTIMLRVDLEVSILSSAVRKRLDSHLREVVDCLQTGQTSEGGWGRDWWAPRPGDPMPSSSRQSDDDVILSTGHHLEWLMLLPVDLQPSSETVNVAARHLLRLLLARSEDAAWLRENFCPATHAARSIGLLSGVVSRHPAPLERSFHIQAEQ